MYRHDDDGSSCVIMNFFTAATDMNILFRIAIIFWNNKFESEKSYLLSTLVTWIAFSFAL